VSSRKGIVPILAMLEVRPTPKIQQPRASPKASNRIWTGSLSSNRYGASVRIRKAVSTSTSAAPEVGVSSLSTFAPSKLASEPVSRKLTRSAAPAPRQEPRPGVLLDRDGTIIVDSGYVGSVERVEFIDGTPEAIARFNQAGVPVAVVTNQAGVARGFYGINDVQRVHDYISEKLAHYGAHIDLFLYCPYHPDGVVAAFTRTSEDRKPRPGMAKAAAQALNLDLASSWVVGDRPEDIGLAEAIGATPVYVGAPGVAGPGILSFPSLAAAASLILERVAR
jgi:histidinol-phosphate phosphatase family protein